MGRPPASINHRGWSSLAASKEKDGNVHHSTPFPKNGKLLIFIFDFSFIRVRQRADEGDASDFCSSLHDRFRAGSGKSRSAAQLETHKRRSSSGPPTFFSLSYQVRVPIRRVQTVVLTLKRRMGQKGAAGKTARRVSLASLASLILLACHNSRNENLPCGWPQTGHM